MRKIKRRIKKLKLNRPNNLEGLKLLAKNFGINTGKILSKRQKILFQICQGNPQLAFYLSHLISKSIHFLQKNKNNQWFFILQSKLKKDFFYIDSLQTKYGRSRLDKKLEKLGFIETNRKGWKNRKYYKIQWQNITKKQHLQLSKNATLIHTYIIYNNIYNSKNKLKQIQGGVGPDGPSATQIASQSDRVISRRKDKYINKAISYWSSLGTPFAKVTTSNIRPVLNKIIKSDLDCKEVIKIIDIGFKYMSHPEFILKSKANISMKQFFIRDKYPTPATEFLRKHKRNSWFTLFKLSSNQWLDENLFNLNNIDDKEVYRYVVDYFGYKNNNKATLIKASNSMALWMKVNSYDLRTMSTDFDNFIHDKYPDIREFELYWLISKKFWNNQFAKYIVNFGRFKHIDEVKKI